MAAEPLPEQQPIVTRAEAIAAGLTRYFLGVERPCLHGHIAERFTSSTQCRECARIKSQKMYWEDREGRAAAMALYRKNNAAKIKERKKAYYKANNDKEKSKAYYEASKGRHTEKRKEYRAANREAIRLKAREKYKENAEKNREISAERRKTKRAEIAAYNKQWRLDNIETERAIKRAWRKANPEKNRAIHAARRAVKIAAEGRHTGDDLKAIFAAQKGKCAYCRASVKAGYQVDHIVALSKGGSNWPSNLQLTCGSCNSRKHNKDPVDFARELGRLV